MRALARLILTVILLALAAIAGYYYGYQSASGRPPFGLPSVGGNETVAGEARKEGSAIGKTLSQAGSEATEFFSDAALTTKIKA